jgi:hypothetical protein
MAGLSKPRPHMGGEGWAGAPPVVGGTEAATPSKWAEPPGPRRADGTDWAVCAGAHSPWVS